MTLVDKDACELLDADHLAVKHLFVEYARLAYSGGAAAARLALARRICSELTVHAQIEEEIFYPALRKEIDAPELLDEAEAEHQEAKALIAQIEGRAAADAQMDQLVADLNRAVEQHVKEERDGLFPKARASDIDLDALGVRLKERQDQLAGSAPKPAGRAARRG
ncbi:hemerythrin domain-containing protein [Caenimonas terrae]|uniref:Hemerythrin domain-containing protein n=1 Tax=Caenimonas terrae TaxID=696074 RepID=A0ABW0NKF2_9BURK